MTCDHCVRAVTEELLLVPGVRSVDVDLETGMATVVSDEPIAIEQVVAAIDEAGYTLIT